MNLGTNVGGIYYQVTADTSALVGQTRVVERETGRMGAAFTKMAAAITAALSAIAVEGLVSKLVGAQRQFDVMFASLKTMTGGVDQAGAAWQRLVKFAAQTPFTLEQSVNGFVKLKALGLDPSERAMTSFGNTASAMGKNLTQMIEAVADASTGEFERLKEFGIKAKVEKDNVALTFRGTTTVVKNSAADITEYLTKLGEVEFAGAMSERMKTLDGDISNLQDSLATLYLTISQSGFGEAIASGVRKATEAIQEATASIKEGALTEYFDRLRPIILAAELAVVTLAGAIAGRLVAAMAAQVAQAYAAAAAMGAATVATRGFAAVLATLGGPIGIAVTGLALLALNWEKIAGSARDAAAMSEDAASRIAAALRRSPSRAAADLEAQLGGVRTEIADIDRELARTSFPRASDTDLAELRQRRETLLKIAADIEDAKRKIYGQGGRPANEGGGGLRKDSPTTKPGKAEIGTAILDPREQTKADFLRSEKDYGSVDRAVSEAERRAQEEAARAAADRARGVNFAQDAAVAGDPVAQLQLELQRKSKLLTEYALLDQDNLELYAEAKVALERDTQAKIEAIQRERREKEAAANSAMLQNYAALFGGLSDIAKTFAGEQSGIYKAMFSVSKAFAIADAIVKIQQGIANSLSLPFPANLAAAATTASAAVGIISTIQGTQFGGGRQYGGPVSSGSLYRVNETGRPEMFTAANGSQYMLPTKSGNVTPANEVGGSSRSVTSHTTININVPPGTSAETADQLAARIARRISAASARNN